MQKLYYSISEVSKLVDEEQHILRYWEKEFSEIKPRKNRAGNRVYSLKDLAVIQIIKRLLREEKLSLKGAKERISQINPESFEKEFKNVEEASQSEIKNSEIPITKNSEEINDSVTMPLSNLLELKELFIDLRNILSGANK